MTKSRDDGMASFPNKNTGFLFLLLIAPKDVKLLINKPVLCIVQFNGTGLESYQNLVRFLEQLKFFCQFCQNWKPDWLINENGYCSALQFGICIN